MARQRRWRVALATVAVLGACSGDEPGGQEKTALLASGAVLGRALSVLSAPEPAGPGLPAAIPDGPAVGGVHGRWRQLCDEDPARTQCDAAPATVAMTPARWEELRAVQRDVQAGIVQRPDPVASGDRWTLLAPGDAGDCEDIAMTKRDLLMAYGWPAGALRPALCYAEGQPRDGGELHAVLTVETDAGTMVLGNLRPGVRLWTASECRDWVMRPDGPVWRWIAGGVRTPLYAHEGG